MNRKYKSFEEARDYILGIPKFTGKNSTVDTREFYEYLGEPAEDCKIIHIAGTNGKGSVSAYVTGILREAGFHVGMFTSPHLVHICERIRLDGQLMSEECFLSYSETLYQRITQYRQERNTEYHPSFFEFLFFVAMLRYADCKPDYLVLETGLGGRLDATNIISDKAACIITRLGMDHMEYLGDTLEQIAGEKAGIIRPNTPVIALAEPSEGAEVIRETAEKLSAPCFFVGKEDISFSGNKDKGIDFSFTSRYYENVTAHLHTIAEYQAENAALAVRTIEVLPDREHITADNIREGLTKMRWEGRMEEIRPNVFIDGAHNTDGIRAFMDTVSRDGCLKRELLFAVVKDKQYDKMVEQLAEGKLFQRIHVTQIAGSRELAISQIKGMFEQYTDVPVAYYDSMEDAVNLVLERADATTRIYIAGSLYLVGSVKELLQKSED